MGVILRISLLKRREDLTHAQFIEHWKGPHAEIVKRLPGVKGIQLIDIVATEMGELWDGLGIVLFDSIEAARAAFSDPRLRDMLVADRALFVRDVEVFYGEITASIDWKQPS